jgi:hypothetical protein
MTAYQAAQHYAKVLRNVAEKYALDDEDAEIIKKAISLKKSDELSGRYGEQPKVIWDNPGFKLGARELRTDFGWIDLSEYGLEEEAARHAEPYSRSVLCFYQ